MNRIGILGGSFDPIHTGHVVLGDDARELFELERVLYVPAACPPHKPDQALTAGCHRLAMVRLALRDQPHAEACELDLDRGGTSYAIDLVTELQIRHPESELCFVIGADTLLDLHNWVAIDRLLTLCRFVTISRPGHPAAELGPAALPFSSTVSERLLRDFRIGHMIDVSATEVRMRAATGRSLTGLVPDTVAAYIRDHGLYLKDTDNRTT